MISYINNNKQIFLFNRAKSKFRKWWHHFRCYSTKKFIL